ncbi:MAG: hypothetical protein ABSE82_04450 [Nitrososphaerales archaeon]|jgi:uncharacterized protein YvpB
MKSVVRVAAAATFTSAFLLFLLLGTFTPYATAATTSITISPNSGIVGTKIDVSGQGYVPNTNLILNWGSDNVSWTLGGNPTETTGIKAIPTQWQLASVQTNASGSFAVQVTAPADYGGSHVIQAYMTNGTAIPGVEIFATVPSFTISNSSGAAGSPITIYAKGLGIGVYSTNYQVDWDNKYIGDMTAVTTHGQANATIYAVGSIGTHFIDIYEGYPGAAYMNPAQHPSLQIWDPPYIPYQTTYKITSEPFTQTSSAGLGGVSVILLILSLALVVGAFVLTPVMAFQKRKNGNDFFISAVGKIGVIVIVAALLIAGAGVYLAYNHSSKTIQSPAASYVPQVSAVIPEITVPQTSATSGPHVFVSPNVATVGETVNVTGLGFAPNSLLPVSWSTRVGSNLNGFNVVNDPLKNVTSSAIGSFTFAMQVPSDLEGDHFISVSNLTRNSNATLYIQRDATVTPNEGPVGTEITIQLLGTGWDFNTNIVVIDYDNSYVGFACGFASQGNITVTIPAVGAPGLHTIDLYPSIYLGPPEPSQIMIYRYPILTPYDHPEKVPSFHFSFLITGNATSTSSGAESFIPSIFSLSGMGMGSMYLASQLPRLIPPRSTRFTF